MCPHKSPNLEMMIHSIILPLTVYKKHRVLLQPSKIYTKIINITDFSFVLFTERPALIEGWKVEKIQEIYLEALRAYVDTRRKHKPGTVFAKLLSVLTELRTLGNQNSEMCFSLKLKNKKIPPFLAEIWDVDLKS